MNSWTRTMSWPRVVTAVAALYCLFHVAVTLGWVYAPDVNEYREWAHAQAALSIFAPDGPYGGASSDGIYLYGLLYPLLGGLLHRLLGGDILVVLRLLSYALTWLVALFAARELRWRTGRWWLAALGCALLLVVDWQNVTGTATPAPLGVLLMLLAINRAEARMPVRAALFTVLAFFVKPYFVAVWLPLQIFFCLQSWRKALIYFAATLFLGLAAGLAVKAAYPYYFVYTVVHHAAAASAVWAHLGRQLLVCALLFFPLFALCAVPVRRHARRVDVYLLCAALLFRVWLPLSLHTGAFMSYAYHLWLPPLVIASLTRVPGLAQRWQKAAAACIFAVSLVAGGLWLNLPVPPRGLCDQSRDFEVHLPFDLINLSPVLARTSVDFFIPSLDNGQGQYVSTLYSDRPLAQALFPEMRDLRRRAREFEPALRDTVASRRWPFVTTDEWSIVTPADMRAAGYTEFQRHEYRVGVHHINVLVWERK